MAQRKLSRREKLRRMYNRAMTNLNKRWMSFSYIMRMTKKDEKDMLGYLRYMEKKEGIFFVTRGRNVVFTSRNEKEIQLYA